MTMRRDTRLVILALVLWAACGVHRADGAGFLQEELPLNVVATTPTELLNNDTTSIQMSGTATITVVFSRAVIALGSDFGVETLPQELVPFAFSEDGLALGRFRWVTTSIARWDPLGSWPPDVNMDLVWNTNLMTYDGVPLELNVPPRVRITTRPLRVTILGIGSLGALERTDDHWDAQLGLEDESLPEVPPDGSIILRFSFLVELAAIESATKVVIFKDEKGINREDTDIKATVKRCVSLSTDLYAGNGTAFSSDCAVIELEGDKLQVGTRYSLIIPPETRYSQQAGPLSEEVSVEFFGLRKFRIPFLWNMKLKKSRDRVREQDHFGFVNGKNISLWLPHGLAEDTSIDDLKSAISLEWFPWKFVYQRKIPMEFEMTLIDKGVASIAADFQPGESYKLFVHARSDVKDGYGLPLQQSEIKFPTSTLGRLFGAMHLSDNLYFDSEQAWDGIYPIVTRGTPPVKKEIKVQGVAPKTVEEARVDGYRGLIRSGDLAYSGDAALTAYLPDKTDLTVTTLDLSKIKDDTGMMLVSFDSSASRWERRSQIKIHIVDYHVFLSSTRTSADNMEVLLWLVDMKTGSPAEGVEIHVMKRPDWGSNSEKMDYLFSIKTDKEGLATFTPPEECKDFNCRTFGFWIEQKESGTVMFRENSLSDYYGDFRSGEIQASLTTAHALVEPGDDVRLIGHVVKRQGREVNVLKNQKVGLTFSPPLDPNSNDYNEKRFVDLDEYGTFEYTAKVDPSARRRSYGVSLNDADDSYLTGVTFTVGEPRIPSALLKLMTPEWVAPGAPFTIEVQATSLLGGNIAEAEMTLKYTIEQESGEEITDTATLVTNSTGGVSHEVDISNVDEIVVGDVIKLTVTWIGPTRERLVETASLRFQKSDKEVKLKKLYESNVPGVEFGVYASVEQAGTGEKVKDVPIDIGLFRLPDETEFNDRVRRQLSDADDTSIPLIEVSKCQIQAGRADSLRDCRLTVPDTGKYVLRGCLDDSPAGNGVVCGIQFMGKTSKAWEDFPLERKLSISTLLLDDEVPYGAPLDFFVDIPLENFSLMVIWGNDLGFSRKVLFFKEKGLQQVSIDIGDACVGGCEFNVQVAAARQTSPFGMEIPTHIEFDPMGSKSFKSINSKFKYKDEDVPFRLNVSVIIDGVEPGEDVDVPVVAPGKNKTVTVAVTRCPGKPTDPQNSACKNPVPASNAKVVVFAVDKAVLSLSGPELVELDADLRTDLFSDDSPSRSWWPPEDPQSSAVFKKAEERLRKLLDLDPWTGVDAIDTYDGRLSRDISKPDDYFLNKRVTPVTLGPPNLQSFLGFLGRELQQGRGRVDTGASSRSPTGEGPEQPRLRSEQNFKTVPLFKTFLTSTDGKGEVQFSAPDNLGTFVVRAYATTVDAQHGSGEAEIINRLPLSLTPSRPRLARVGDDFEAGTIITVSGDQKEGVPVTVTLLADPNKSESIKQLPSNDGHEPRIQGSQGCEAGDLSCLVTLEEKVITSDVDGQVEVRFRFSAERLGNASITIRADIPGNNDAVQMSFPVLGQQEAVRISTSFAIEGNEQGNAWEEGLKLPVAVPGSGSLDLKAGVGQFPAILTTANSVIADRPREPYANGALANVTLPHVLRLYGLNSGDEVYDRAITAFKEGEYSLNSQNLTTSRWGLVNYPIGDYEPRRPDVSLNAWGIWVIDQIVDPSEKLKQYRHVWRQKLEEQFVKNAEEDRKNKRRVYIPTIAHLRLALGPEWSPVMCPSQDQCTDAATAARMSMSVITDKIKAGEVNDLSVSTRAKVALTWLKHLGSEEGKKHPDVVAILDSFRTSIRTVGRTSFIAYRPDSSSRAGMSSQALALLAMVRSGDTGPLVEKLVNHVASEGGSSAAVIWSTASTKLLRMLAMAEYDVLKGSNSPDLALTVRSGETTVLEGEFRQASDPVVSETTSFDSLGNNPGPLMFTAQGQGEVSLVATLDFIPARLLPFPTYRGLFVERCIQKAGADGEAKGPCLSSAPLGAQLVITLQITSPDDLGSVSVRALMSGGIEPVDPLIASDSEAQTTCFLDTLRIRFRYWYWPLCPRQETRPAVVTFRYGHMRAGSNTIRFQAIAASVGDWILPPVQAFVDDQPEVMGLSPAGKFKVCDDCKAEVLPPANPPRPCPNNCSGSGICDLTKGACECDAGFVGTDCSQLEES